MEDSREDLVRAMYRTVDANGMSDGVHVRLMVTRGIKKTPSQDPRLTISPPTVVIIAEHKTADPTTREKGVTLFTSTVRRGSPDYLDPRLNCHSKLHEVIALVQALEAVRSLEEGVLMDIRVHAVERGFGHGLVLAEDVLEVEGRHVDHEKGT